MEHPPLSAISYAQFSERLNKQVIAKRIPINGSFELTFRCNLRCVHCYCNLPLNDQDAIEKELTSEEVLHIFDQIAEAGCLWLLLTGGEPLVRKDFLEIYTYAKKKGFLITLFNNSMNHNLILGCYTEHHISCFNRGIFDWTNYYKISVPNKGTHTPAFCLKTS